MLILHIWKKIKDSIRFLPKGKIVEKQWSKFLQLNKKVIFNKKKVTKIKNPERVSKN